MLVLARADHDRRERKRATRQTGEAGRLPLSIRERREALKRAETKGDPIKLDLFVTENRRQGL